ncbi:hypothetical protein NS14008_26070 [Nocardia seriolae]|nr:hypothetical protein [Nocardia seriolae]OJF82001.1 hypothetical protein NS14008_26070 [Nocardia seriolae]PSK27998.1 hypothetical protein C6575_28810 [Nocardia seriolae]QUN18593.1 hypothetical protein KEC46_03955 [Nocardia seriolae]
MAIAGTLFATAAGIAAAEPTATGPQQSGTGASPHVVVTYDYNGYPTYDYVYTDPAPQPAAVPGGGNRLGSGASDRTCVPVLRPDGSGWTVCRPNIALCQ